MASYKYRSSRRFSPYRWVQGPNERRRYPFYTTPWGDETPSSPVVALYDSNGLDVTSTYTSDTYLVSADAESEIVGSNIIWTRFVTGLEPGQTYRMDVSFALGGNTMIAYGLIDCQEYGSKLTQTKEDVWMGTGEKMRYQLDTRPWQMDDTMVAALGIDDTLTSPVVTVYDENRADVTSTYTTNESSTAPTEISSYWVRTLFVDDLIPAEYRFNIKFVLNQNTYECWARLFGEG